MLNYVSCNNYTEPDRYIDSPCDLCHGIGIKGCSGCFGTGKVRHIVKFSVFGTSFTLDTQEQRKEKGAKKCPTCGCFCSTETEGE